jgi:hypothetical protein
LRGEKHFFPLRGENASFLHRFQVVRAFFSQRVLSVAKKSFFATLRVFLHAQEGIFFSIHLLVFIKQWEKAYLTPRETHHFAFRHFFLHSGPCF